MFAPRLPKRSPSVPSRVASNPGHRPSVGSALAELGRPLDSTSLEYFGAAFGHDFSSVRVHTGDRAAASASSLSARAYTVGHHVVLGRTAEHVPRSAAGRHLLAHELAHVVQQSRGGASVSFAETPGLEASANLAADRAVRGERTTVSGASGVGIARQSMFDQFSAGTYAWPILQLALTHGRPVETIIDDINALPLADRDRAIKDITEERTAQARKLTELIAKQEAQTDPALQAVFEPMLPPVRNVVSRADQILDGLFVTIAHAETPASLKSGTVAATPAQTPLIESAIKPDLRTTSSGAVAAFDETIAGDPKSYVDKLREAAPPLIAGHHKQQVDNRGQAEHSDPTKVHALTELERVGNASKRETDQVFGQYKKGPALKADTKTVRGNIHDLW